MENNTDGLEEFFGETVSIYTRAQALEDGLLVDVSERAREAGFRIPVTLTAAVWVDCVAWDAADIHRQTYQDEQGRLWDVLWMAARAARHGKAARIAFQLFRVPRGGRGMLLRLTTLHMHLGPGDDGEPVITILMPDED